MSHFQPPLEIYLSTLKRAAFSSQHHGWATQILESGQHLGPSIPPQFNSWLYLRASLRQYSTTTQIIVMLLLHCCLSLKRRSRRHRFAWPREVTRRASFS